MRREIDWALVVMLAAWAIFIPYAIWLIRLVVRGCE